MVQLKSGKAAQFHREFATNRADDDCMTMVTRRACGLQPHQGAWTARSSLHGEWLAIRHVKAMEISRSLTHCQGRSQEFIFSLLGGASHTNLYKNLIKIQIFNVNLGTIGGQAPPPSPHLLIAGN